MADKDRKKKTETQTSGEERLKGFLDMIAPSVVQFYTDHYICGNTLRIYTRQVTPAEEKKIISNAANKNRMKQGNTENLQETVTAASNLQDVTNIIAAMHRNREPLLHTAVFLELSAQDMHEYYDYLQRPTRENASEFITQALENNLDIIAKKKNYMDYLGNRPRVEKTGTHGLFSSEGESIVLSHVADEVANHTGVVWTNVISLRREDAQRLGYDSAAQWQALLRSRVELLCENYKIDSRNLKWYAAFHNESHHPHVHLVVYSANPSEGYLTKKGIYEHL